MVTVRNYIPGEYLPWNREEIGYDSADFDPEWTWVVFVDGELRAILITAKMLNAILLVRLLSTPGRATTWLRPLWSHIRSVCVYRKIAGFWTSMDNKMEPERKLLKLLQQGRGAARETMVRDATGVWVTGRF